MIEFLVRLAGAYLGGVLSLAFMAVAMREAGPAIAYIFPFAVLGWGLVLIAGCLLGWKFSVPCLEASGVFLQHLWRRQTAPRSHPKRRRKNHSQRLRRHP